MKTFNVIDAELIAQSEKPAFIGISIVVDGREDRIARSPKQVLLDLHKSARGSKLPANLFDNGYEAVNPLMINAFREEVIALRGKAGYGDVEFYLAGSEYVADENSTLVKEGKALIGDVLLREKNGARVEGFLSFPLSDLEVAQKNFLSTADPMLIMQGLFGIVPPVMVTKVVEKEPEQKEPTNDNSPERKALDEAFGSFDPANDNVKETVIETEEHVVAPKGAKASK